MAVFHLMLTWRLRLIYVVTLELIAVEIYVGRVLNLRAPGNRSGSLILQRNTAGPGLGMTLVGVRRQVASRNRWVLLRGDRSAGFRPIRRIAGDTRCAFGMPRGMERPRGQGAGCSEQ
jgi:hypothetical protein